MKTFVAIYKYLQVTFCPEIIYLIKQKLQYLHKQHWRQLLNILAITSLSKPFVGEHGIIGITRTLKSTKVAQRYRFRASEILILQRGRLAVVNLTISIRYFYYQIRLLSREFYQQLMISKNRHHLFLKLCRYFLDKTS